MKADEIEEIEIDLLLETLRLRYGYDFRHYARASLKRRVQHCLVDCGLEHAADLIPRLLRDPLFFNRIVFMMSVTVTEMFRDPPFFQALRDRVLPKLRTWPFLNIWLAGCATGEEVYSLAILLTEEGLYDRSRIFATDLNDESLGKAREGVYSIARIQEYTANYNRYGGRGSFADYYHAKYGMAKMNEGLKKNIIWAKHNLVTDHAFTETHLILCRNVLIYFDEILQNRVLRLFRDALSRHGFLCLGSKESLRFSEVADAFQAVCETSRIHCLMDDHGRPS